MDTAITLKTTTVDRVIECILAGSSLKDAVKQCDITISKFHHLLRGDKQAAIAYARAVEIRADILADEALTIADTENDAAKARNQIQVRQWLASKLHVKRYGDRIDLNVTQTIDIGSTLAEARARLLPVSYQQHGAQSQVIDVEHKIIDGASDKQSHDPQENAAPDIFS